MRYKGFFTYCLLPIAYCLLPIASCLLPLAFCLPKIVETYNNVYYLYSMRSY
ncbi:MULTISPECIES: hypothetical protein [Moorena]|uniref:Uncharacterized protein n=1 Tax=Moorena producens (strain JHB) TaxID=1454205 RepID=A0A9Q9SUE0_MOOP1|nr:MULTISPECIES: hypothetical protein [Moorena]NEP35433.1 hypothetical protein [Moorena sp. SIO3B2]NEP66280.1 hypothetical protein [Moorena sp. SIO3A5]NER88007.1 hypothetical protein [Moorena sp. SIO3A2]NET68590.1 hypothetical protein [Moorena sp. SIO1G6]WAN69833.1 hypothetical protein BJP36_37715 [Moorena producens JHB]